MKRNILLFIILISTTIFAQQKDSSKLKITKADIEAAEKLIPRPALHPVKSSLIAMSDSSPIDTLDTVNEKIKVILYSDNTWKYWKDPSFIIAQEDFTKNMSDSSPDAYSMPYSSLPTEWSIWLVDDVSQYCCPVKGSVNVRGKFGMRRYRRHQGVDISLPLGTPVHSAFDGKVRISKYLHGYGNLVVVRHTNGLETFYGHLSERKVEVGDWVTAGEVIGLVGSTGRSTGPHLHFETRHMGYAFDPQWIIDFSTGDLRRQLFVLKKKYFSANCNYEQNFDDEIANEEEDAKEAAEKAAMKYHTIKSGDTLGALARKYHTSVKRLCQLNGIKETTLLQLGKKLRVN